MHYAMIMAGGSGTRLWPMSRAELPKQLIPFIEGKSLLRLALDRFEGMIPSERRYVCAGLSHRQAILSSIPSLSPAQFLGEPMGRDTLNAVGLSAAVLGAKDPAAILGVFTADHLIEPVEEFQRIIAMGFSLAERCSNALVTFGIEPTGPTTGYGYLELGDPIDDTARVVRRFREKPPRATAEEYVKSGPEHYLWNSGMFVWRAATLLDCIGRYEPAVRAGLADVADAWETPHRDEVLQRVYPGLKKISIDFAVMEPASRDPAVRVAAIPMRLRWLDVGSWPAFAETCPHDADGNALAAQRRLLHETRDCLVASSDPEHLIATIGCRDLVVIHTPNATLVCRADMAEKIKDVQKQVETEFGPRYT
ncbi:MAG: mannose-1-phosphate guanylyltransferase [Thermoguttaceae bacterium]